MSSWLPEWIRNYIDPKRPMYYVERIAIYIGVTLLQRLVTGEGMSYAYLGRSAVGALANEFIMNNSITPIVKWILKEVLAEQEAEILGEMVSTLVADFLSALFISQDQGFVDLILNMLFVETGFVLHRIYLEHQEKK